MPKKRKATIRRPAREMSRGDLLRSRNRAVELLLRMILPPPAIAARASLFSLLLLLLLSASSHAQTPAKPLRVATRAIPPFVFEENGKLAGFSIDLWQTISQEMGSRSETAAYPTVVELLATVKSGKADLGIAAISITAERSREFDFSQ